MEKLNCWEDKNCGREPGGRNVHDLGVCPVAVLVAADGINGGKNGGRACWAVAGTLCGGEVKATLARKLGDCLKCDFFKRVVREEGASYANATIIARRLGGTGR
jgi:hypothetical protein